MTRLPRHRSLAAAAALVLAAGLTACGDDEPTAQDPGGDETTASTGEPTEEPTDDPDATSSSSVPADTVTVPVYFVGQTPQGPRLYREFRKVEADNPLEEALALLAAGDALDPDYGTLLPAGGLREDSQDELLYISLPDSSWAARPAGMSEQEARLAVQQIVYTAQGVAQERIPVGFVLDGASSPILGLDEGDGFKAAPQLEVLAFMNVTTPEEGAAVSGAFTAEGVGSSFEATVLWEVRDGAGAVVLDGFTTAEGWMDKLYPWTAEVDVSGLSPGTYTFAAVTDDPSDGEGAGPTEDTKTITVS